MGPILNGYRDMVKRKYGPSCEHEQQLHKKNITTNITCMQVLTIALLMICNGQNPGSSTSGTSHKKFSKMPPPTSMHLWTRCRVLRVACRSSWWRSFIWTQPMLMQPTRSARVSTLVLYTSPFSHPHKQKSKGVKSGERAGQWIRLPRPIHRLGYVLFRCWITILV